MMQEQHADEAGSSRTRRVILQATIQLYREIGYKKTTVTDIARRAAMSPANVYRFFRSKQEIEEAVVAEVLEKVFQAAANAARDSGSPVDRVETVVRTIAELHARRLANDKRLDALVVTASDASWPITLAFVDRVVGLLSPIIEAGQAGGEIREGSAATLARCLFAAMDAYVWPREFSAAALRPPFDQMMAFCVSALRAHVRTGCPFDGTFGWPEPIGVRGCQSVMTSSLLRKRQEKNSLAHAGRTAAPS
jgi:AcrR family transcriptional regulator